MLVACPARMRRPAWIRCSAGRKRHRLTPLSGPTGRAGTETGLRVLQAVENGGSAAAAAGLR